MLPRLFGTEAKSNNGASCCKFPISSSIPGSFDVVVNSKVSPSEVFKVVKSSPSVLIVNNLSLCLPRKKR